MSLVSKFFFFLFLFGYLNINSYTFLRAKQLWYSDLNGVMKAKENLWIFWRMYAMWLPGVKGEPMQVKFYHILFLKKSHITNSSIHIFYFLRTHYRNRRKEKCTSLDSIWYLQSSGHLRPW